MEQLRQELEAVRTRLIDSGVGSVEPVGVAVDANAETVAGQEVPSSLRPCTRRGTGTGRRPVSSIGSRASTPGTAAPVRHRRVLAASVVAVGVVLTAIAILYWQRTRSTVSIEPSRPAVEAMPAPLPETPPAGWHPRAAPAHRAAAREASRHRASSADGRTSTRGTRYDQRGARARCVRRGSGALVDDLARAARQSVNTSRAAAAKIGVTESSSADLRDARRREREADALERSGNRAATIRALWMAAALYERTVKTASARSLPPDTRAPAAANTQGAVTGPPQPERVQSPAVVPLAPGALPPGPDPSLHSAAAAGKTSRPGSRCTWRRHGGHPGAAAALRGGIPRTRHQRRGQGHAIAHPAAAARARARLFELPQLPGGDCRRADRRRWATATVTCRVVRSFVSRTVRRAGTRCRACSTCARSVGRGWSSRCSRAELCIAIASQFGSAAQNE